MGIGKVGNGEAWKQRFIEKGVCHKTVPIKGKFRGPSSFMPRVSSLLALVARNTLLGLPRAEQFFS